MLFTVELKFVQPIYPDTGIRKETLLGTAAQCTSIAVDVELHERHDLFASERESRRPGRLSWHKHANV